MAQVVKYEEDKNLAYSFVMVCPECQQAVGVRQQVLECNICNQRVHRKCSNRYTQAEYRRLVKQNRYIDFQCRVCTGGQDEHVADEYGIMPAAPAAVAVQGPQPEGLEQPLLQLAPAAPDAAFDIRDGPLVPPPLQPLLVHAPPEIPHFDIRGEQVVYGPHLQVEPEQTLEEAMAQDAVPVTYSYLESGSKKGRPLVVSSDGYAYSKRREARGGVVFRCTSRTHKDCSATITVFLQPSGERTFIRNDVEHDHPVSMYAFRREAYVMAKQDALAYSTVSTSDVRRRAVSTCLPDEEDRHIINAENLNRTIQRTRQLMRPAEPKTPNDPLNLEWLTQTCPDLKVYLDYQGQGGSRVLVFATLFHLEYLSGAQMWFLDGTFKVIMG